MNIEIIRIGQEAIIKYEDENGIHKIGLGLIADRSDSEILILANAEIQKNNAKVNLPPTYQELRLKEYFNQGITIDALSVALWEDIVEKKPQARIDIQVKREAVKLKYPKN